MKLYHGSFKEIESFKDAPIWCANSYDAANDYVISQAMDGNKFPDAGEYGCLYEVEVNEKDIVVTDDFDAVDGGEILKQLQGEVFEVDTEHGWKLYIIRNACNYKFTRIA